MEIAKQENIGPTDAMLTLVRAAMGRVAYVDAVLTEGLRLHVADGGSPLEPPAQLAKWLQESRLERKLAAQTAKAAVDAGAVIALTKQLEMDGGLVADALTAALDSLDLDHETRMRALGAAQERLLGAGETEER